jgi:hypothetical protein
MSEAAKIAELRLKLNEAFNKIENGFDRKTIRMLNRYLKENEGGSQKITRERILAAIQNVKSKYPEIIKEQLANFANVAKITGQIILKIAVGIVWAVLKLILLFLGLITGNIVMNPVVLPFTGIVSYHVVLPVVMKALAPIIGGFFAGLAFVILMVFLVSLLICIANLCLDQDSVLNQLIDGGGQALFDYISGTSNEVYDTAEIGLEDIKDTTPPEKIDRSEMLKRLDANMPGWRERFLTNHKKEFVR